MRIWHRNACIPLFGTIREIQETCSDLEEVGNTCLSVSRIIRSHVGVLSFMDSNRQSKVYNSLRDVSSSIYWNWHAQGHKFWGIATCILYRLCTGSEKILGIRKHGAY
jgi:hypothetical protein